MHLRPSASRQEVSCLLYIHELILGSSALVQSPDSNVLPNVRSILP